MQQVDALELQWQFQRELAQDRTVRLQDNRERMQTDALNRQRDRLVHAERAREARADLARREEIAFEREPQPVTPFDVVTPEPGDTLASIAEARELRLEELVRMNRHIADPDQPIPDGVKVIVPRPGLPAQYPTPEHEAPSFSHEQAVRILEDLYRAVLGRSPDEGGAAGLLPLVESGRLAEVVNIVVLSGEARERAATITAESLCTAVYTGILQRPLDPSGYAATLAAIARGSLAERLFDVLTSPEYAEVMARPPVTPVEPSINPSPLVGRLRIEGGAFVDDTGPVLPTFAHFGEAFSRYVRDPDAVRAQLDTIAAAGYDGIRFWTTLGGSYWAGREVSEQVTPDYWNKLAELLRDLEKRQLRAVISQGDIARITDRNAFADRLSDVLDEVGSANTVAIIEAGNEAWQTGEPDPKKLAEFVGRIERRHPEVLYTLTSPPGEGKEELDAYSIGAADLFDVHGYRGGHWWDKVRHIFSITYEGQPNKRLGWQGEPAGPGGAVSCTENQHELDDDTLAAMAAMSLMSRQAWCYMSGPGVLFDSPLDKQPGFWTVPKIAEQLPRDLMTFERLCHGGQRWANDRIFAPEGETRADHAIAADGRFVVLVYGPELSYHQVKDATIEKVIDLGGKAKIIIGRRT